MKKQLLMFVLAVAGMAVVAALFVGAGVYNVAADDEHSAPVHSLMATTRDRSIAVRAAKIEVPNLADAERIRRGAGNYDSMCVGCHLRPGADETELSRGLYPKPPQLARSTSMDPAQAFWVIKHGIKATGMPAWGKSMADSYIWDMVAFLKRLPQLDAGQYRVEVRASGGHSHGGGETMESHEGAEHSHSHEAEEAESGEHSHSGEGHSHAEATADSTPHEHQESPTHGTSRQKLGNAGSKDPVAVVEAFHSALSRGSAAEVQAILDPKVLIMEAGNVERSREEYASHHLPADLKFMSTVSYHLERQSGDSVGDLAWVASEARMTGGPEGKAVDLISTESLVLRRTSNGWKIVHIHWSSRSASKA